MRDLIETILRWPYRLGPLELTVLLFATISLMVGIGVAAVI